MHISSMQKRVIEVLPDQTPPSIHFSDTLLGAGGRAIRDSLLKIDKVYELDRGPGGARQLSSCSLEGKEFNALNDIDK